MFLYLLCGQGTGLAETMYVTDRLYLSLRNAPDPEQRPLALLPSDTKVDVLDPKNATPYPLALTVSCPQPHVEIHSNPATSFCVFCPPIAADEEAAYGFNVHHGGDHHKP